jgi:cell wall-associated NlpC family hydrolase
MKYYFCVINTFLVSFLLISPMISLTDSSISNSGDVQNLEYVKNESHEVKSKSNFVKDFQIISNALDFLGVKYKLGGRSDSTVDCSGLVGLVYEKTFGIILPPTAKLISQASSVIKFEDIKVGDLIFFNTTSTPFSHVGIYIGENRFIHASSKAKLVKIDYLTAYYLKRLDGYRRVNVND